MKKLYTVLIIAIWLCSCSTDDDFSSDSSLSLSFSSGIVSFDTVFTTIGSATKQFKVYNRNNKSLLIQSIELVSEGKSGFRINIDGEKGTRLENIEILKKDSLFGFVEVTVNPSNTGNPVLIKDSIKFVTNGNAQYLQLEAVGQDVFIWKTKVISTDSVITSLKPILIYDSLVVKKNVSLTIEKGVTFFLKNKATIQLHGNVKIKGTVTEPVVFRGDRFDKIEGDIPYDNAPGQWGGFYIYPESYNNEFENVYIKNTLRGMTFYTSDTKYVKAVLFNTIVHNSSEYGIQAVNCKINASNCLFSNSRNESVKLYGGEYSFIHCTIANYYRWSARTSGALVLSNYINIGKSAPLSRCDFFNSVIYGSVTKEVLFDNISSADFNFRFGNCLIKGDKTDSPNFTDILWNENPLFKDINSEGIYNYNFELTKQSPAIDKANKAYSVDIPYDLKGKSRLSDSNPDIGCYEWTE